VPRQQKALAAVSLIRETTERLIAQCKAMVDAEDEAAAFDEGYVNDSDPSVLRFLIASRHADGWAGRRADRTCHVALTGLWCGF
jgi:hypothetical protein